jgi:hypothetical protein
MYKLAFLVYCVMIEIAPPWIAQDKIYRTLLSAVRMSAKCTFTAHRIRTHKHYGSLFSRIFRHYAICDLAAGMFLFQDLFQDALDCVAPLALDKRENNGHKLANHATIQTQLGEATNKAGQSTSSAEHLA